MAKKRLAPIYTETLCLFNYAYNDNLIFFLFVTDFFNDKYWFLFYEFHLSFYLEDIRVFF